LKCEFWGGFVEHNVTKELTQVVRKVERASSIHRLMAGGFSADERWLYADFQNRLFEYIEHRSGKNIIVDSSKSSRSMTGRFLAMKKLAHQDVYVLHLVRNGLDTMSSLLRTGSNWDLEGYHVLPEPTILRATIGWVSANAWTNILGAFLPPERYLRLRYEDFISEPSFWMRKVSQFAGFDPGELIDKIERDEFFEVGHQVGGNRVRLKGRVKLQGRDQSVTMGALKPHQQYLFLLIGGWLHLLYGYGLSSFGMKK
jgi:hypothetical protein